MKEFDEDLTALNRQLTQATEALYAPPKPSSIQARADRAGRRARVMVGFGSACLVLTALTMSFHGWRDAGFMASCAVVELTRGLFNLLCIGERRLGRVTSDDFLRAVHQDSHLAWFTRGGFLFSAGLMGLLLALGLFSGPNGLFDYLFVVFLASVVVYEAWMLRGDLRRPSAAFQGEVRP